MRVGRISTSARHWWAAKGGSRLERDRTFGENAADEREAVGVDAVRGESQKGVAGLHGIPGEQGAAFRGADTEPGEVVVPGSVDTGHFGSLPSDEGAPRHPAASGDAGNDIGADLRVEFAHGEVVEKEQRLCALGQNIVDAHGDKVDADGVVNAGLHRKAHLGAGSVRGRDQDRVAVTRRPRIEETAETAEPGIGAGAPRGSGERCRRIDNPASGIEIDACIPVGEPRHSGHSLAQGRAGQRAASGTGEAAFPVSHPTPGTGRMGAHYVMIASLQ